MTLKPNGSVQNVRIIESSGNEALDASLIRAIRAASPFSIPREQFEVFRDNKIRFHPLR
jgi:TonB family protein